MIMAPTKRNQGKRSGNNVLKDTGKETYFDIRSLHDILEDEFGGTVEPQASVFLMGVMQYIAAEIIEVSVNAARSNTPPGQPVTITPKDIVEGLESDAELKELFDSAHAEKPK